MRLVKQSLSIVVALFAGWPLAAQVQPEFPNPPGPFEVGRFDADVTDSSRDEIFTDDATDKRRLLVTVYYPASATAGQQHDVYGTPELAAVWPFFDEERRAWVSPTYAGVAAADGRFPVLLFSPGLGNLTLYYTSLLADIASRGFVVAALWHPYSTQVVAFADNTVVRSNEAGGMGGVAAEEQPVRLARLGEVWAGDQRFVLDQLTAWNVGHAVLRGHLDLDRVGAFGHSLGGAAAAHAAQIDERIDAAINMDGAMFGPVTKEGSRAPFLLMQSEIPAPTDAELQQAGLTREQADALLASIIDTQTKLVARSKDARIQKLDRARHNTFMTDLLFFTTALPTDRRAGLVGDVEPATAFATISRSVAQFMTAYVAGPPRR
jgi:pimeloyl-ACP methyl ester carboxylesterase